MRFELFAAVYDAVMPALEAGITALLDAYIAWVARWIGVAVALLIGWRAIQVSRGKLDLPTFWGDCARAGFVWFVAANVGTYDAWVRVPLQGVADDLGQVAAGAMGNGNVGRGGGPFDAVLNDALLLGLRLWQRLGWTEIGPMLVVIVFWVAGLISTGFAFILKFGTEIFLKILLAVGPVFFGLAVFETMRGKLYRWLDACSQRIALMALAVIFVQVLLTAEGVLLQRFAGPGSNAVQQMIGLMLGIGVFGVMTRLALDLPRLASDMTGGSGSHGVGAAAAATFGLATAGMRRVRRAFA